MRGLGDALLHPAAKPLLWLFCMLPMLWLFYAAATDKLGANPAEALSRSTGELTLRFLCMVLAISPLRVVLGLSALARFRRMLGLFVYAYVCLHLLSYAWFDMGFDPMDMARDIAKRPCILVGFIAFLLLTPLALTSFNRAIKTMGVRRWQQLHRAVYLVTGLAVLHFFWMRAGKNDFGEVLLYAVILGALLAWRLWRRLSR